MLVPSGGGASIAVADAEINEDTLTLTIAEGLEWYYTLHIAEGALGDLAGNVFEGSTNARSIDVDTKAPILSRDGANENLNINLEDKVLILTFNEVLNANILNAAGFQFDVKDNLIRDIAHDISDGYKIQITLDANDGIEKDYTLQIAKGSLRDLAGNPIAATDLTVRVDTKAPTWVSSSTQAVTLTNKTIVLTFSENLAESSLDVDAFTLSGSIGSIERVALDSEDASKVLGNGCRRHKGKLHS